MADPINIVLADDHPLLRRAVRTQLHSKDGLKVIAEAADGQEAVRLVRDLRPNLAIVDAHMPKLNGIEAARKITGLPSPPKVIILTAFSARDLVFKAFEAGCFAYVLKSSTAADLIVAIHEALEERWFLSAQLRHLRAELEEWFGR